ncbi:MAG: type II secretion system F family protein [Nanoarchaeota archaeon]
MYRIITRLYPSKLRNNLYNLVMFNNITVDFEKYTTFIIIISVVLGMLIGLLLRIFLEFPVILLMLGSIILVHSSIIAYLVLSADSRARFVEDLLPDALQLMASNLRAGMTIDRALLLAARPEFGQFQEEINRLGKEIATGKEFESALMDLGKRYRSEKLQKTVQLIVSGVASGGSIADLLEQTAGNLRQQRLTEQ